MNKRLAVLLGFWLLTLLSAAMADAAVVVNADPSNYRLLLSSLEPGDTLNLASGQYPRLAITDLDGTPAMWITITGPTTGAPAVIAGADGFNTVEILNSSYVAIENLRIDSRGIPGAFGISAKGHESNLTHDIRIEGNTLIGQNGGQQTVGISTKTPTWGWVIRRNQILGAGTGLYLGESDGTQPFVGGIVENNLIRDTIGYNMQIKDQNSIPSIPGMPMGPTSTIIRNNVFIKNDQPSPDGDRPNLIVGAFPERGAGSLNQYEIYGNYFLHNHREALFQGSGRISLHDNIFVDGPYTYSAVVLRSQNFPLKIAYVYSNTIYTSGRGIYFGTRALIDDAVIGNLIFALTPIAGLILRQSENMVDLVENAPKYVNSPSFDLGSMDFYPRAGRCQGEAIDLTAFKMDAYTLDFNGTPKTVAKGATVFRGAYAGDTTNPGWRLQGGIKPFPEPHTNQKARLIWISPPRAQAGSRVAVTLTGANFDTGTAVAVSGSGIAVNQAIVASSTEIAATLVIDAGATAGIRDVTVVTSSGTSNAAKFQVTSRGKAGSVRKKD